MRAPGGQTRGHRGQGDPSRTLTRCVDAVTTGEVAAAPSALPTEGVGGSVRTRAGTSTAMNKRAILEPAVHPVSRRRRSRHASGTTVDRSRCK